MHLFTPEGAAGLHRRQSQVIAGYRRLSQVIAGCTYFIFLGLLGSCGLLLFWPGCPPSPHCPIRQINASPAPVEKLTFSVPSSASSIVPRCTWRAGLSAHRACVRSRGRATCCGRSHQYCRAHRPPDRAPDCTAPHGARRCERRVVRGALEAPSFTPGRGAVK